MAVKTLQQLQAAILAMRQAPDINPRLATPIETHLFELVQDMIDSGMTGTGLAELAEGSIPYGDAEGNMTSDATGLSYDGTTLSAGHSDPSSDTGISINGGRGAMVASLGGVTIKAGVATGGTFDTTKHVKLSNGTNTPYLDTYTTGAGPYVQHFNIPLLPVFADDTAAGVGGLVANDIYRLTGGGLAAKL